MYAILERPGAYLMRWEMWGPTWFARETCQMGSLSYGLLYCVYIFGPFTRHPLHRKFLSLRVSTVSELYGQNVWKNVISDASPYLTLHL